MLFYCGNQWGYTPLGSVVNVPTDFCNQPVNLKVKVYAQYATLSWTVDHDYLKFILEYRKLGDPDWIPLDVNGQSITLTLEPETAYEWRVKTVCSDILSSVISVGPAIHTDPYVAGCAPVGEIIVTNMGGFYQVTWAGTGAQYYKIYWWLVGPGRPLVFRDTTQNLFYNLPDNLIEGATYGVYVEAYCQDSSTPAVPSPTVFFVVGKLDCKPPGNMNFKIAPTVLVVVWGSAGPGLTYNVYLNDLLVATAYPGTSFTFTGLTPGTLYKVDVRTNCTTGFSPPKTVTVTTPAVTCPEPSDLEITGQTTTGFTATWVPAPGIASQQIILNNGAPIALGAAITNQVFSGLDPGGIYTVLVRSICSGSASNGVSQVVTLGGCAAPGNLTVTDVTQNSITFKWSSVGNALLYRVVVTKIAGSVVVYDTQIPGLEFTATGLEINTPYKIDVYAECGQEGSVLTESVVTTLNTATGLKAPCESAIIDNLVIGQTTVDITFHFASGLTNGFIKAVLRKTSDDSIAGSQDMPQVQPVSFTGLLPNTQYAIYIYNEVVPGQDACTPLAIDNFTTTALCQPPTNLVLTMNGAQTELTVNATASPSAPPTYQLEYMTNDMATWISAGAVTLPHTITGLLPGRYYVRLRSNCAASVSTWLEGFNCPLPKNVNVAVSGNSVQISWDGLLGVDNYAVELVSLIGGTQSFSSTTNWIDIENLPWNTTFVVTIKAVCSDTTFGVGDSKTFSTGAQTGGIGVCVPPSFTVYVQDCTTSDPGQESICKVTAQDWTLLSAIFVPIGNDAPNDTYIEATFSIPQTVPLGDEALMPGGVLGIISTPCLPLSSTTVDLEIIQGGTVVVADGTLATNGNITVSGSYESDGGSYLIVRIKGNYNKV